jgi:peptide/nickel transport system substrate-binding protein
VPRGGKLIIAVPADPSTLDPHVNSVTRDTIFLHALFDRLIERGPDGTLYPGLAKTWEVANDGVTWTLTLRDDVFFHDGTPFNAEAAVYNFERIVNPDTKSEYAVFQLGPYESSRAIDEFTLELKMAKPYGALPVSLATFGLGMVSPKAAKEAGDQFGQRPVGSGPFKFKEWVPQSHVTFVRNPDYNWASPIHRVSGPAPLEEVTFRVIPEAATRAAALRSGEVDLADVTAAEYLLFEKDDNYRTQKLLTEGYPPAGLFINTAKFPTDDVRVRKALAYAVDRQEVNQVVFEGLAEDADSVVSKFSWAYDPASAMYSYDPERAKALLDEAGWVEGGNGFRQKDGQELTIVYLSLSGVKNVAEVIQAQLKKVGIKVELLVQDNPAQQQSAQSGVHNLVWTQWSGVDPADLAKVYHSSNIGRGWNFAHYNNPELDKLFDEGVSTNDLEERKRIYHRIINILMDDATFIPLYNRTTFIAMKKYVQGTDVVDERGAQPRIYDIYLQGS